MLVQGRGIGESIEVPVTYYLIEHDRGTVLFDTGISYDGTRAPEEYGLPAEFPVEMEESDRIQNQLARVGMTTADVDVVVLSHLHFDHAGELKQFPDATILVHRDEIRYAFWPDPFQQGYYCYNDFRMLRERDPDVRVLRRDRDLFGDGSLRAIELPGHTPGHLGLQCELQSEGTVVLTADCAHHRDGYEAGLGTPFDYDFEQTLQSYERLRGLERTRDARVVVGHDPVHVGDLPEPPEYLD